MPIATLGGWLRALSACWSGRVACRGTRPPHGGVATDGCQEIAIRLPGTTVCGSPQWASLGRVHWWPHVITGRADVVLAALVGGVRASRSSSEASGVCLEEAP
eukprot:1097493-Amphidinium_carterae.3